MSADKIAEIRKRHERIARTRVLTSDVYDAHADRATLLAEVERLGAKVERLREALRWYGSRARKLSTPHDAAVGYSDLIDDGGEQARKALEGAP